MFTRIVNTYRNYIKSQTTKNDIPLLKLTSDTSFSRNSITIRILFSHSLYVLENIVANRDSQQRHLAETTQRYQLLKSSRQTKETYGLLFQSSRDTNNFSDYSPPSVICPIYPNHQGIIHYIPSLISIIAIKFFRFSERSEFQSELPKYLSKIRRSIRPPPACRLPPPVARSSKTFKVCPSPSSTVP